MKCATTTQYQSARTYRKKTAASTTNKSVGTFQGMCHSKGGRWFAPCYHKLSQTKDAKQHSCNKTIKPLSKPVHTYQDHGKCCAFIFVHSTAYLSHLRYRQLIDYQTSSLKFVFYFRLRFVIPKFRGLLFMRSQTRQNAVIFL